jgi:hypothetical protein
MINGRRQEWDETIFGFIDKCIRSWSSKEDRTQQNLSIFGYRCGSIYKLVFLW